MPFQKNATGGKRIMPVMEVAEQIATQPELLVYLTLMQLAALNHGFYCQVGLKKDKSGGSFMIKDGAQDFGFYFDSFDDFVGEVAGTIDIMNKDYPKMANDLRVLTEIYKGLKDA